MDKDSIVPIVITIDKLVHGGQGLGKAADGRKIFVWNALPGETVTAQIIKKKRSYAEAIAIEIANPSADRVAPREANYLATSPWQILDFTAENAAKKQITLDVMAHEKVTLPTVSDVVTDGVEWQYRNKMEYSFWGDDEGLHLALHQRGSHGKQIVEGSALALPEIDDAAQTLCAQLTKLGTRAGDLKTAVLRADRQGNVVMALFVKLLTFKPLELPKGVQGLRVWYSNPKSPASVTTELLQEVGDVTLTDTLLDKPFTYDVDSFFQVNLPVFEKALARIKEHAADTPALTDMYAGVGSIGLSVAGKKVTLVELDLATAAMAGVNAVASSLETEVIETSAEQSLEYITADQPVIVDPPRAGLHPKVVEKLLSEKPPKIIYLSCNPATQARDLALLQEAYTIDFFEIYNFFPKTPHIESLAVLSVR